ncbi:SPL family radical SAM protein [Paenibacillus koleovorans]|uniref:SPL family radical SAM protein n=1 Tax=Paenibacillus koleovorans TaxID=121608 RepID=UPI000FD7DD96|nr:radical SAM protein [Paenibacillus koleovorans]
MTTVRTTVSKQLLSPTGGYLTGYTHTLNPYSGCAFACSYCYVRRMPIALFRGEPWGEWVDLKSNAATLLKKDMQKARKNGPVTIFMSSATDPYQPVEAIALLTRSLLETMAAECRPDFLFVQTRSPLVTRDLELFQAFGDRIRVSVTVETDEEAMRKAFSPAAPPIPARMKALRQLREAGIPSQAAVSPVLPSSPQFAEKLAEVTERVVVDDFFRGDGSGGSRTKALNMGAVFGALGLEEWYRPEAIEPVFDRMRQAFGEDRAFKSREGFLP